jgi:hypothetical protein
MFTVKANLELKLQNRQFRGRSHTIAINWL